MWWITYFSSSLFTDLFNNIYWKKWVVFLYMGIDRGLTKLGDIGNGLPWFQWNCPTFVLRLRFSCTIRFWKSLFFPQIIILLLLYSCIGSSHVTKSLSYGLIFNILSQTCWFSSFYEHWAACLFLLSEHRLQWILYFDWLFRKSTLKLHDFVFSYMYLIFNNFSF